MVRRFNGYIIGGVRFHTKEMESKRKNQNSGVAVTTKTSDSEDNIIYSGVIKEMIEMNYFEHFTIVLFKCDWFDTKQGREVKKDALGFELVNFSKLIRIGTNLLDEPFVFASQVQQVFYIQDSLQPSWHIVVRTKPRDVYEMGDDLSFESSDEHHVQDDEMLDVDNDGIEDLIGNEMILMTQLSSLKSTLKINLPQKMNYKFILNTNPF